MKNIADAMGKMEHVMNPDELAQSASEKHNEMVIQDDYDSTSGIEQSDVVKDNDLHVYMKPGGDERYLVRVGKIAVMSIGTEPENYALKRLTVWSPMLEGEVFDESQVNAGNLQLVENVPEPVTSTINRTLSTLNQVSDALGEYVY